MKRLSSPALFFLVVGVGVASGCADAPRSTTGAGIPAPVVTFARTYVDTSRPTVAQGAFPGASDRTLATRFWIPDPPPRGGPACRGDQGCGLVILAHGLTGRTERLDAFARGLAAEGWVVAAPTFPSTSQYSPGGAIFTDVVRQPADVSFVAASIRAEAAAGAGPLDGLVDGSWLALVGHSLGGATAIGATRLECCRDATVAAAVLVAPATIVMPLFREPLLAEGPPTLVLQGTSDPVVSPAGSRDLFAALLAPRAILEIEGAAHSDLIENSPAPGAHLEPALRATASFLAAVRGGDAVGFADTLAALEGEGHAGVLDATGWPVGVVAPASTLRSSAAASGLASAGARP